ncbi:MAG: WecB/TagA/CpsF family glycosyltransferase [Methylophaga sp.]
MVMQPNPPSKVEQILQKLAIYDDSQGFLAELSRQSEAKESFTTVGFLNQHGFNLMLEDKATFTSFQSLDFLLRDGIGISLALKYFSRPDGANLNGTDLIPQIVETFNDANTDYFVLGTQSPWLERGSNNLLEGKAKAIKDGFYPADSYISFLQRHIDPERFSVIILAMGMPKQETLATKIKGEIKGNGVIICGGAILDFYAGRFKRAPAWVQKCSLEWLYRLIKEPRRLFKRYVIGIPVFLFRITFRA